MYPSGSSISQDQYVSVNLDAKAAHNRCSDNNTHLSWPQVTMLWQTDSMTAEADSGPEVSAVSFFYFLFYLFFFFYFLFFFCQLFCREDWLVTVKFNYQFKSTGS